MESKIQRLKEYLAKKGVTYVTGVRAVPDSDSLLLTVPETAVRKTATGDGTSLRKMKFLAKAIDRDLQIKIDFLISRDRSMEGLEAGLDAALRMRFPNVIENCFTSFLERGAVDVWLEGDSVKTSHVDSEIKKAIRDYLKAFRIDFGTVHLPVADEQTPSKEAIMKEIKTEAPVLPQDLAKRLQSLAFKIPSVSWLERQLDAIRRSDWSLRREDGRYVLTEKGLDLVPHGKGRQGSDVIRALALAKKKW